MFYINVHVKNKHINEHTTIKHSKYFVILSQNNAIEKQYAYLSCTVFEKFTPT